ncbi:MAG: plastocyanin/azurin family copper-binding protein [Ilumatobacter sp.]
MRRAAAAAALCLAAVGCAPDGPDTYTVAGADAPPATRPPLPTTTTTAPDTQSGADDVAESVPEPVGPATFPSNGEIVEVRSLDNSFIQATIEIEAGTTVNWINGGRNDHNILPVDESLTWGVDRDTFVPGTEYANLFDTPGVFAYYCSIHGTTEVGMVGAVIVTEPS